MSTKATLVASLGRPAEASELEALSGAADVLEVRADLAGDLDPERLRGHFAGRLLYTLRSATEGGRSEHTQAERRERLVAAGRAFDLVDLETRDLEPVILEAVPAERRLLSWHGPPSTLAELKEVFERLASTPARYYKLVPAAARSPHELAALALLESLGRDDVVAFASGEAGVWSRLIAPRIGAPLVFGAVDRPAAPGQPSLAALSRDYGLPALPPLDRLFGVVGSPVLHSLSPRLHNGLYRHLGIAALYLPFHAEAFGEFWLEVVESGSLEVLGFELRGLSVTAPHKEVAMAIAGAISPLAEHIESANTLVRRQGVWEADSTDHHGVLEPLAERGIATEGRPAVVVGAGGGGRAAAFALARAGARVVLSNRSARRGRETAGRLGLPFVALEDLDPARFELLVNATPLGRGEEDAMPFDPAALSPDSAVIDLVYRTEGTTPLVRRLEERGHTVVGGREVLLHQARRQFELMTGREMPLGPARELLDLPAAPSGAVRGPG